MTHLEPELLAHLALHPHAPVQPDHQAHLADCDPCQADLRELRETAELARSASGQAPLHPAPPAIWDRIVAELGPSLGAGPEPDHAEQPVRSSSPNGRAGTEDTLPSTDVPRATPRPGGFRRTPLLAAAAAIGLIAGILGTWGVLRDDTSPTPPAASSSTQLKPLAGKTGTGSADLFVTTIGPELKIVAAGLAAPRGYYEVWLINTDLKRMVSLGVLDPVAGGTFRVPTDLIAQGYRIVDVSLEPYDGDPLHSTDSIIRGSLPA